MQLSRLEKMKAITSYGLAYALWALCLPLGGWVIYELRDLVLTILAIVTAKQSPGQQEAFYANLRLRAADTTSWLLVGAALVAVIVTIENIYRTGVLAGRLWSRFFLVVGICFGLLSLFGLTRDLLLLTVDAFSWRSLFAPAVYALVTVVCFWLWDVRKSKEKPSSISQA